MDYLWILQFQGIFIAINSMPCVFYQAVVQGHVTFKLQKNMAYLGYVRTCYIWVMEGPIASSK